MASENRKKKSGASGRSGKVYVNLGLTPGQAEALRKAGKPYGRPLATECLHRITAGATPDRPDPFAGWPPAEARQFRELGDAVALLASRVALTLGGPPDTQALLGYMRAAIDGLVAEMGAAPADPATAKFMGEIGRMLAREAARAGDRDPLSDLADAFSLRGGNDG